MRCLYCGKELALLKRLTKGGEFCSEAHKQRYQEEYDRIALSRLLQAQKKVSAANSAPDGPAQSSAAATVPIAVEEPAAEQEVSAVQADITAPAETAGFLPEKPIGVETTAEYSASFQPWLEPSPVPIVPIWSASQEGPALSSAAPVRLKLFPKDSDIKLADTIGVIAGETSTHLAAALPQGALLRKPQNRLRQFGQLAEIDVAFKALSVEPEKIEPVSFTWREFQRSPMLELPPASIEFAEENAHVVVPAPPNHDLAFDQPSAAAEIPELSGQLSAPQLVPEPIGDRSDDNAATPHATLEALSRLHQVMQLEPDPLEKLTELVEVVTASPESSVIEPVPRKANDLIEVSLKTFAPPKKLAAAVNVVTADHSILLPRLRALPLRPKVGLAPLDAVPKTGEAPPGSPPQGKAPGNTAMVARPPQKAEPAAGQLSTEPAKAMPAGKPQTSGSDGNRPLATTASAASSQASSAPRQDANVPPAPNSAKREQPPGERATAAAGDAGSKPESQSSVSDGGLPAFGGLSRSSSWVGRLFKIKLITVALLSIGGGAAYFLWGTGKSSQKAVAASPSSSGGAGSDTNTGQGEWVSGWGADSADRASGRDITIYRPSLKLSDYRIEFLGDIETKSMGWVFRASDPENYYAMKLSMVAASPAVKVALFKYIMVRGRQTQVGRVPIDVAAGNDTLFKVRVDVRGPKFSTYVQGQPVDVWMDDQLKSGGVGFLNESGERGRIKSVSIRYLTGSDS